MKGDSGNREAEQAKRKGPCVRSGDVKEKTTDPCAERATQTEADLQQTEDKTDFASGKNVRNHRSIDRIAGAVADRIKHGGKINKPHGRTHRDRDQKTQAHQGDEYCSIIGSASPNFIGDESPQNCAADADKADEPKDEGGQELVVAERNQVGDEVSIDQEKRRPERELGDGEAPERKRRQRFAAPPMVGFGVLAS